MPSSFFFRDFSMPVFLIIFHAFWLLPFTFFASSTIPLSVCLYFILPSSSVVSLHSLYSFSFKNIAFSLPHISLPSFTTRPAQLDDHDVTGKAQCNMDVLVLGAKLNSLYNNNTFNCKWAVARWQWI
jgi:hypothetical protein